MQCFCIHVCAYFSCLLFKYWLHWTLCFIMVCIHGFICHGISMCSIYLYVHTCKLQHILIFLQGSWEKRLIERINNQKGSATRKRPRSDDEVTTPTKRGRPKESTLLCRYPALQFGESDEVAISRNKAKLNEEAVKPNPSKTAILPLQRLTYASRRDLILSGLDSVADILKEHPVLHLPFAVSLMLMCVCVVYHKSRSFCCSIIFWTM